jgi:Protein of unknown function (DUF1343)
VGQADSVDPKSGLPVVSLYGAHARPTPDDLRGLDALVYDLQDAGVRFYTYVSTEIQSLEAAADAGVPFVVLDRPNPIGGNVIAGPVRQGPATFVATAPGPLVYGLTDGEMAQYVNAHLPKRADLTVVPMKGWTREMTWEQTGRRWIPPSPGLPTADAARFYAGIALFEGTDISEGRGTIKPFQAICAPWLDANAVANTRLAGISLQRVTMVAKPLPTLPDPKFNISAARASDCIRVLHLSTASGPDLLSCLQLAGTAISRGTLAAGRQMRRSGRRAFARRSIVAHRSNQSSRRRRRPSRLGARRVNPTSSTTDVRRTEACSLHRTSRDSRTGLSPFSLKTAWSRDVVASDQFITACWVGLSRGERRGLRRGSRRSRWRWRWRRRSPGRQPRTSGFHRVWEAKYDQRPQALRVGRCRVT